MCKLGYLGTKTFFLEEPTDSDKKGLLSVLNDYSVCRYIHGLYFTTIAELRHLFVLANMHNSILLAIKTKRTKKVIGVIFAYINPDFSASVSYVMHSKFRGKGIMPEALKLFITHLYEHKLAKDINFYVNMSNTSSMRVMEKLHIPFYEGFFHLSLDKELPF